MFDDVIENGSEDVISEDPFSIYKSKGFGKTRFLLKAEGIHKRARRFVLWDNFSQTIIVMKRYSTVVPLKSYYQISNVLSYL